MLRIGKWIVDESIDELRQGQERIKLEPRTMRLLCLLAEQPGRVVSADEILSRVWTGVIVGQNSVYQAVAQLRRILGDTDEDAAYIATVPRKGYRLVAEVGEFAESSEPQTNASEAQHEQAGLPAPKPPSTAAPWRWVTAAALAALALLGYQQLAVPKTTTTPKGPIALAVLPFADLSAAGDNSVFCDGLTDEVLNTLSRLPGFKVTGRTSTFALREQRLSPQELSQTLGVDYLLEGSIRRNGNRLRIAAQLINAKDGFQVWANTYDRAASGAISVQADISRAVIESLRVTLSPQSLARFEQQREVAPNAYDLYLLGRHQQLQRNAEALQRSIAFHQQAIAADPNFALAYAGLADAQMAGIYYRNQTIAELAPIVQKTIDQALRLDPELPEAHAAQAVLRLEQWRMDEAIASLKRAIAIDANYTEAYMRLGAAYVYDGKPQEALQAFEEVQARDPLNARSHEWRCGVLKNLGQFTEAERACQRALEIQPDIPNALWTLGQVHFAKGDSEKAIKYYEQAITRDPNRADIRGELGTLLLDVGLTEQAAKQFAIAVERAGGRRVSASLTAARHSVVTNDMVALRRNLNYAMQDGVEARLILDAAFLALTLGDSPRAERLRTVAMRSESFSEESIRPGNYLTFWGICEVCALALLERNAGDIDGAERRIEAIMSYLDYMETNGHRWHGLEYVRATLFAQRGQRLDALNGLERAEKMGWRRGWLLRVDPSLAKLRDEPRFIAMLSRIDKTNSQARATLSAQTPTR